MTKTPKTFDEYWKLVEESGLVADLPKKDFDRVRKATRMGFENNPATAFLGLATDAYDAECIENDDDYVNLMKAFVSASSGRFKPTKVRDSVDFDEAVAKLSFDFAGQHFEAEFECEDDYVDADFDKVIEKALKAAGVAERFFYLPGHDQCGYLVYVRPEVYKRAVALGVIPRE